MSFGDSPPKAPSSQRGLSTTLDRFDTPELPPQDRDLLDQERQLILQIRGAQNEVKEVKTKINTGSLPVILPKEEVDRPPIEVCSCHGCFVQTLLQSSVKVSADCDRRIYSTVRIFANHLKSSINLSFISTLQRPGFVIFILSSSGRLPPNSIFSALFKYFELFHNKRQRLA